MSLVNCCLLQVVLLLGSVHILRPRLAIYHWKCEEFIRLYST